MEEEGGVSGSLELRQIRRNTLIHCTLDSFDQKQLKSAKTASVAYRYGKMHLVQTSAGVCRVYRCFTDLKIT